MIQQIIKWFNRYWRGETWNEYMQRMHDTWPEHIDCFDAVDSAMRKWDESMGYSQDWRNQRIVR